MANRNPNVLLTFLNRRISTVLTIIPNRTGNAGGTTLADPTKEKAMEMPRRKMVKVVRPKVNKLFVLLSVFAVISCGDTLYHRFEQVGNETWCVQDTIEFLYEGSLGENETGIDASIELRHTAGYGNRFLNVRMELLDAGDRHLLHADTFSCEVYDEYGRRNGETAGALYQLSGDAVPLPVSSKDTVIVRLMHIMGCERLKGVADVGIRLSESSTPGQHQF